MIVTFVAVFILRVSRSIYQYYISSNFVYLPIQTLFLHTIPYFMVIAHTTNIFSLQNYMIIKPCYFIQLKSFTIQQICNRNSNYQVIWQFHRILAQLCQLCCSITSSSASNLNKENLETITCQFFTLLRNNTEVQNSTK